MARGAKTEILEPEVAVLEEFKPGMEAPRATGMPRSPGARVAEDVFFDFVDSIPPEEWGHLMLYVYRWWPVIDRRLSDPSNKAFIDKVSEPIEDMRDWLLRTWGTGIYNLKLNDTSVKKGGNLTETVVKFPDPYAKYPPVLDYRELELENKDNRQFVEWAKVQGFVKQQGENIVMGDGGAQAVLLDVAKRAIEEGRVKKPETNPMDAKVVGKAVDYMFEKAMSADKTQRNPGEELALYANTLKSLGLGSGNSQGDIVTMVIKMQSDNAKLLAESQQKQMDMLVKMMELNKPQPQPQGNMVDQMKSIAEVFGIMHEIGLGGGGKGDWKSSLVETVGDALPKMLQATSNLLGNIAIFRGMKPGTPVPPNQMMQEPVIALNPGAQGPQVGPQAVPPAAGPQMTMQDAVGLGSIVYDAINRNMSGVDWGASFIETHGRAQYEMVRSIGKETLVSSLQMVPELWKKFEGIQPSLHKFLDEFMQAGEEYDKLQGQEVEGEEDI